MGGVSADGRVLWLTGRYNARGLRDQHAHRPGCCTASRSARGPHGHVRLAPARPLLDRPHRHPALGPRLASRGGDERRHRASGVRGRRGAARGRTNVRRGWTLSLGLRGPGERALPPSGVVTATPAGLATRARTSVGALIRRGELAAIRSVSPSATLCSRPSTATCSAPASTVHTCSRSAACSGPAAPAVMTTSHDGEIGGAERRRGQRAHDGVRGGVARRGGSGDEHVEAPGW